MLKVRGDPLPDNRLHLARAPVRPLWVAYEIARFKEALHRNPLHTFMTAAESDAPDLAALLGARLCHDLISPLGAIRNGLELLEMSAPEGEAPAELQLVSDSLETALARLRYFRLAFGPADPRSRQPFAEAVQATDAMFAGRFTATWETRGPDMPRPVARLIYLAILCLEKSLPMGGCVRIAVADDATAELAVEGRRTAPPAAWTHVTEGDPIDELRADCVQFALLRRALVEAGQRLTATFTDTGAELHLMPQRVAQPA